MILEQHRNASAQGRPRSKQRRFDAGLRDPELCPICYAPSNAIFIKKGYPIHDCLACGHRFAATAVGEDHVEHTYDDSYFNGAGDGYSDYLSEGELLVSHGRRYARLLNRFMKPGTVLDVGTAAGFILSGFESSGWAGTGLEPNPTMADFARHISGVAVETGTLEKAPLRDQYDLVTMIQVVAHFVDPHRAFEAAIKLTKPGGYWLIETWDRNSWTARVLGKAWHEYNPPSVLHWFSIETLGQFVQDFGLEEVARGRPTKWISSARAKSIASNDLGGGLLGNLIEFGMKLVPEGPSLPYVLDDIYWALFRNN